MEPSNSSTPTGRNVEPGAAGRPPTAVASSTAGDSHRNEYQLGGTGGVEQARGDGSVGERAGPEAQRRGRRCPETSPRNASNPKVPTFGPTTTNR